MNETDDAVKVIHREIDDAFGRMIRAVEELEAEMVRLKRERNRAARFRFPWEKK